MTNNETRALAAAILRAVAAYIEQGGGDLVGTLAPLVDAARGEILTGDAGPLAIPRAKLDQAERKRRAVALVRDRGHITSGELARAVFCSDETARVALGDLVRKGVLLRRGQKRGTVYRSGPYFPRAGAGE